LTYIRLNHPSGRRLRVYIPAIVVYHAKHNGGCEIIIDTSHSLAKPLPQPGRHSLSVVESMDEIADALN